MALELLIICITVFVLTAPWAYAKAAYEREKTQKLAIENDKADD